MAIEFEQLEMFYSYNTTSKRSWVDKLVAYNINLYTTVPVFVTTKQETRLCAY